MPFSDFPNLRSGMFFKLYFGLRVLLHVDVCAASNVMSIIFHVSKSHALSAHEKHSKEVSPRAHKTSLVVSDNAQSCFEINNPRRFNRVALS